MISIPKFLVYHAFNSAGLSEKKKMPPIPVTFGSMLSAELALVVSLSCFSILPVFCYLVKVIKNACRWGLRSYFNVSFCHQRYVPGLLLSWCPFHPLQSNDRSNTSRQAGKPAQCILSPRTASSRMMRASSSRNSRQRVITFSGSSYSLASCRKFL